MGDLNLPNEKYAETEQEEAEAEFSEDRYGEDIDDTYDRVRDDNSMELIESVEELIDKLSKLMYYKNRSEGLAKDIIQTTLNKLKLKIKSVDTYPTFQHLNLIKKEEVVISV
jgi:DNA-binding MurR/RpiR family transcriptional regulator